MAIPHQSRRVMAAIQNVSQGLRVLTALPTQTVLALLHSPSDCRCG